MDVGLYDKILTEILKDKLNGLDVEKYIIKLIEADPTEISVILGKYMQVFFTYFLNQLDPKDLYEYLSSNSAKSIKKSGNSKLKNANVKSGKEKIISNESLLNDGDVEDTDCESGIGESDDDSIDSEKKSDKTKGSQNILFMKDKIRICNEIIDHFHNVFPDIPLNQYKLDVDGKILKSIYEKKYLQRISGDKKVEIPDNLLGPTYPLSYNALLIGSSTNEPYMMDELKKEILTADSIDFLISFIRYTGLMVIFNELEEFTKNSNNKLRILTTTYIGATEMKALLKLSELPNTEIKVSYNGDRTRLHAKAYIFNRKTKFGSAYIGSSNLSYSAISTGLEWNVKIAEQDSHELFTKANAAFLAYWNDKEFELFRNDQESISKLEQALSYGKQINSGSKKENIIDQYNYFTIEPYSFQKEILEKLHNERVLHNRYHNLVVAATGTGKTLISAFDFQRFYTDNENKSKRLLFIAHREEILKQSLHVFREVLRDYNFGDLWVGGYKPTRDDPEHLFISIQTLYSKLNEIITAFGPDYFDFIIVDEFHHGASDSYIAVLDKFKPKILLGLTATPERMDGKSITDMYFGGRIAAELRLTDAINQKLLSPFHYFMVTDPVDLEQVKWVRGGYDDAELEDLYVDGKNNFNRCNAILQAMNKYLSDISEIKGLGFCVGKRHVHFMSKFFTDNGIPSLALTSESLDDERNSAKEKLQSGEIKFIFVVDLYNEGVDIPEVNTVLFLRPTKSLTIFLQQLGRGLRLHKDKDCLTVLDFVGNASQHYNFTERIHALMDRTTVPMYKQIMNGFSDLPKGCFITLEPLVKEYLIKNIRSAIVNVKNLVNKLKIYREVCELPLSLSNFLYFYKLQLSDIYKGQLNSIGWNRLLERAGIINGFDARNPDAKMLLPGIRRLTTINSKKFLEYFIPTFDHIDDFNETKMGEEEKLMWNMLIYTIWLTPPETAGFTSYNDAINILKANPDVFTELKDVFKYLFEESIIISKPFRFGYVCPIELHCRYTLDQILSGFGYHTFTKKVPTQQGVINLKEKKTLLLFITLNKREKDYSPTTAYNDYSINEELFHWQSQSTTDEDSALGQLYINSTNEGYRVLLFVRNNKQQENGVTPPYYFLGDAIYVSHEGSRPMSIIWKLNNKIPSFLIQQTNKLLMV